MRRGHHEAICKAYGRVDTFGEQSTVVKMNVPGWLITEGPIGPVGISDVAADLIDIALVIHRSERQLPRRGPSNPNVRYELTIPVRETALWSGPAQKILQELLGFLGNAEWQIRFVRRPKGRSDYEVIPRSKRSVTRVALLSGGLDSACGAGAGYFLPADTQLCSYYTRQKSLQREIASELGFDVPTQWRHQGPAGAGRSFYYRSFLFLALAAVTADTWRAREIIQCENGILASAVPPVPSLSMTRHAHPKLHELLALLLEQVLGGKWRIVNPLWQLTKRQAVHALVKTIGEERSTKITSTTQTCWNISAPHVFGVRKLKNFVKRPNEECGVCIPCIVRRTALPRNHYAFDLRDDIVRRHPKLGAHFLEYVELLSAVRAAPTTADLRRALPAEALDLIDHGWSDLNSLEGLFRSFADEFFEAFF